MDPYQLLAAVSAKIDALIAEFEGKALSQEKQTELDGYLSEAESLQHQIKQLDRAKALQKFNTVPVGNLPLNRGGDVEVIGDEIDRFLASPAGRFKSFGEQLAAVALYDRKGGAIKDLSLIHI